MNISYHIIKKNDNTCFICLDNMDYYMKFNCECHNYLHQNCIKNFNIKKCFICHKEVSYRNVISANYELLYIDIDFVSAVIEKINVQYILNLTDIFLQNNNFFGIIVYFIVSIIFTFGILLPILILSVLSKCIKNLKNYHKINWLFFIVFLMFIIIYVTYKINYHLIIF